MKEVGLNNTERKILTLSM